MHDLFALTTEIIAKKFWTYAVSAGGKATITSLAIISSRISIRHSYVNTVSVPAENHNIYLEPSVPALTKASPFMTVRYRNNTHAFNAAWTAQQPWK